MVYLDSVREWRRDKELQKAENVRTRLHRKNSKWFFYGGSNKHWSHKGKYIFSDAPCVVVVYHKGNAVGWIGFSIHRNKVLKVIQLQGARRAKLHGVSFDEVFFPKIEELARDLSLQEIWVLPARRNRYWEFPTHTKGREVLLEVHQERLRVRYDEGAKKHNYNLSDFSFWWVKKI